MIRFFGICLVLAIGCIAAVVFGSQYLFPHLDQTSTQVGPKDKGGKPVRVGDAESRPAPEEKIVKITEVIGRERPTQTLILADGRVLPGDQVDVATDRAGLLVFLATKVHDREYVPADKLIVRPMTYLAVTYRPGEPVREDEKIPDPTGQGNLYRHPRITDTFEPGTTSIVTVSVRFRKLAEDDDVKEGDILGLIRPDLALTELQSKQAKLIATRAEHGALVKVTVEMNRLLGVTRGLVNSRAESKNEVNKAEVQYWKAKGDEDSKKAGIDVNQKEVEAAWTTLKLHTIRAPLSGTIRTLYKQPGEAVKDLDQVLQIQNTRRLRVQTQVEVQDALELRKRIDESRRLRERANRIARERAGPQAEADSKELRARADALVAVEIEASRPQAPLAVLRGHLQEVNCVAVSRGPNSRIISGGVEGVVRIWERVPGEERWEERAKLDHFAPIRTIACTGSKAKQNLLLTATSDGRVRIFDLDNLKTREKLMPEQHKGPINAAAFNAEGTTAATGGDDRVILLWNVAESTTLLRKVNAHQAAITSLAFTPGGQLVSAGRDKGLFLWSQESPNGNDKALTRTAEIPGRSGDVTQLGLDSTGQYTLVDEGRELRVLALKDQHIEGSLANSGASGSFSTFALFSPDSKSILTNGAAAGRLQLWRAPSTRVRAAELRQFLWSSGTANCAAFDPSGAYAVTGTSDGKVLVWKMPTAKEATSIIKGELSYVEGFLDTSNKRVTVRATLENTDPERLVIPGAAASIVVPPPPPPK